MKRIEHLSLRQLLVTFLASTLLEALLAGLTLLASINAVYAVLAVLAVIDALFAGCAIHMNIRIKKLHL